MLELFPFLGEVKVVRQWAGIADMTPDFSPVMGLTPVENYFIDSGWGTWGFKATPVCGKRMAETRRHREAAETDRAVRARPLRQFRPGRRTGRGLGRALRPYENPELSAERPAQHLGIRLRRRGEGRACAGRRNARLGRLRLLRRKCRQVRCANGGSTSRPTSFSSSIATRCTRRDSGDLPRSTIPV